MNWYLKCLKQYADFNGRARRKEFWMFVLFNCIFAIVLNVIDLVLIVQLGFGIFHFLYFIGIFIPNLAVGVRRLHDIGKSGVWLLIALIPIVGSIWLLVLMVTEGNPGDNQYGKNPKEQVLPF
jgi:uncharacterized membrane protein YhaH (DUF805 family)